MIRPPNRLKPLLLPVWNGAHHFARSAGDYLNALRHRRFERCVVCGRVGLMLYRRRVIPKKLQELWGLSERLAEALARKESCECSRCGAKLRARRLAEVLLETYRQSGEPVRSIAEWVRTEPARALRTAEINRVDGLHERLGELPNLAYSDFLEGGTPGVVRAGTRHEDLTRLTYPDASFDLVITSETLEHVPDLDAALGEIRRVLVPGGLHIFTIPLMPGVPKTFARASLAPDGRVIPLATPIRHPGGDVGYPVFTEFGADCLERFERAGFEVEMHFGPPREDDVAQVFKARASAK